MKFRLPFVSNTRHQAEIDAARKAHEADNKWLLDQLKQTAKKNIELERKLSERKLSERKLSERDTASA